MALKMYRVEFCTLLNNISNFNLSNVELPAVWSNIISDKDRQWDKNLPLRFAENACSRILKPQTVVTLSNGGQF